MPVLSCPGCGRALDVPSSNMHITIACGYCRQTFCPATDAVLLAAPVPEPPPLDFREEERPRRRRRHEEDGPGINYSYLNCALFSLAIILGTSALLCVLFCLGLLNVFTR